MLGVVDKSENRTGRQPRIPAMRRSARQGKRRLLKTSWFRFIVRSRKTTMIPMLPISPGIHPPVTSLRFFMSLRFCMSAFHAAGGLEDRDGDGDAAPARDSLAPHAPAPAAEAIVKEAPRLHSRAKRGRSWNARSPPRPNSVDRVSSACCGFAILFPSWIFDLK